MLSPTIFPGEPIHVGYFACGCLLLFFGFHIAAIGNNGLTAKVLSGKTQGRLCRLLFECATYIILMYYMIMTVRFSRSRSRRATAAVFFRLGIRTIVGRVNDETALLAAWCTDGHSDN